MSWRPHNRWDVYGWGNPVSIPIFCCRDAKVCWITTQIWHDMYLYIYLHIVYIYIFFDIDILIILVYIYIILCTYLQDPTVLNTVYIYIINLITPRTPKPHNHDWPWYDMISATSNTCPELWLGLAQPHPWSFWPCLTYGAISRKNSMKWINDDEWWWNMMNVHHCILNITRQCALIAPDVLILMPTETRFQSELLYPLVA